MAIGRTASIDNAYNLILSLFIYDFLADKPIKIKIQKVFEPKMPKVPITQLPKNGHPPPRGSR
jgi:hypothetical protein